MAGDEARADALLVAGTESPNASCSSFRARPQLGVELQRRELCILSETDHEFLEIGWITKAHGIRGSVIIHPLTNLPGRFEVGMRLLLSNRSRDRELTLLSVAPYNKDLLVTFEAVTTRTEAEALKGFTILAEPVEAEEEMLVHELIGCSVVELDGTVRGIVKTIEANPASDLLVLESNALVPLAFVVEHDRDARIIRIDPPQGLFDL